MNKVVKRVKKEKIWQILDYDNCISKGAVGLDHVHTDENLTDSLTKWLTREKIHNRSKKMSLMLIKKWVYHDHTPT